MNDINKLNIALALKNTTIGSIENSFYSVLRSFDRTSMICINIFKIPDFIIIDPVNGISQSEWQPNYRHIDTAEVFDDMTVQDVFHITHKNVSHANNYFVSPDQPMFIIDNKYKLFIVEKQDLIGEIKYKWYVPQRFKKIKYIFRPHNIRKFENRQIAESLQIIRKYYKINNFCELIFNNIMSSHI